MFDATFWNRTWENDFDEAKEWYVESSVITGAAEVKKWRKKKVLVLGCGVDSVGEAFARDFPDEVEMVVQTDSSALCLDFLKARCDAALLGDRMRFVAGDLLDEERTWAASPLLNGAVEYDVVIDKGFSDTLMCRGDAAAALGTLFRLVSRVLAPQLGRFLIVSAGVFRLEESDQPPAPFRSLSILSFQRVGAVHELHAPQKEYFGYVLENQ